MKKSIWVFLFIFMIQIVNPQNFVYAEDNSLDLNTVISKTLNNSSALKNVENKLSNLQENYQNYNTSSLYAQSRFEADTHYKELLNKDNLSLSEKKELDDYIKNYASPLTDAERITYKKAKDLTIPNIDYAINMSTLQKQVTNNALVASASELYANLIKVNNGIDIEKSLIQDLQKNYDNSLIKLQNGLVSNMQIQVTKLNLDKEQLQLSKLERNKEYLINNLNKLMGEDIQVRYSKYEAIKLDPIENKTLNDYLTPALQKRLEIQNADQAYDLKQKEYDIIAEVYLDDNNLNKINAKYDLTNTKTKKDTAKTKVEKEIKGGYKAFQNKIADYKSYQNKYDIQKSNYEDILKKYSLGLVTDANIMDVEVSLKNAQIQMDNARIDTWIYQLKMKYAAEAGPAFSVTVNN